MKIKVNQWRMLSSDQKLKLLTIAQEQNHFTLISNGVKIRGKHTC